MNNKNKTVDLKERLRTYIKNDKLINDKIYQVNLNNIELVQSTNNEEKYYIKLDGFFINSKKEKQKIFTSYGFKTDVETSYFYAIAKMVKLCVDNNVNSESAIEIYDDEKYSPIQKIQKLVSFLQLKSNKVKYFVKVVEKEILGKLTQIIELNI